MGFLIFTGDDHVVALDRRFQLPARRGRSDYEWKNAPEYQAVIDEATRYERTQLRTMETQKGAPLSADERVTGVFDRQPTGVTIHSAPESNRDTRNFAREAAELMEEAGMPVSRAYRATLARESRERDEELATQQVERERSLDPEVRRARTHATNVYENVRRNAKAPIELVRAAQELRDRASGMTPDEIWEASKTIESQHDELRGASA